MTEASGVGCRMGNGWRSAWLERSLPALHLYTTVELVALAIAAITIAVKGSKLKRRVRARVLAGQPSTEADLRETREANRSIAKRCFWIAVVYLLHAFGIIIIDVFAHSSIEFEKSETWTNSGASALAIYVACMIALFIAAYCLFPMAQLLALTALISRTQRSTEFQNFFSSATSIALLWSQSTFFAAYMWVPEDGGLWRYTVLFACFGSANTWLELCQLLVFLEDEQLEREDIAASRSVKKALGMLKRAKAGCTDEEVSDLPKYEIVNEKDSH